MHFGARKIFSEKIKFFLKNKKKQLTKVFVFSIIIKLF